MSLVEGLKDRREKVSDEDLESFIDEILENQETLMEETRRTTVKHGSDSVNFQSILHEGLVPGSENSSTTGESANSDQVSFSTSFPVALRYAELTGLYEHQDSVDVPSDIGSVDHPVVVEMPVSELDMIDLSRGNSHVREALMGEISELDCKKVRRYANNDLEGYPAVEGLGDVSKDAIDGDPAAIEVVNMLLDNKFGKNTYGEFESARRYDVFQEMSFNELEGDFLQEVRAPSAPVDSSAIIYVPHQALESFRQTAESSDTEVHSLEARALLHEERMKDIYINEGKIAYDHPSDTSFMVNCIDWEENADYNPEPGVIDISRLSGELVYDSVSNL